VCNYSKKSQKEKVFKNEMKIVSKTHKIVGKVTNLDSKQN
jgi:hypothetical protein